MRPKLSRVFFLPNTYFYRSLASPIFLPELYIALHHFCPFFSEGFRRRPAQVLLGRLRLDGRGAAVEEIVREAEQFPAALRDQPMHRLIGIEEARPRHSRDVGGKRGRTRAAVKRVVSVPQGQPLVVVPPGDETDR